MTLTEAPPLTALLYARVSHDPTGRGRSVDDQLTECRAWAEREGWTVGAEVRDVDRSASRHAKRSREGWSEVVRLVETGEIDVLVTWEASRAQRNLTAYNDLRELCERTSTSWAYSGTVYNLGDRSDRFRTGLDALVSEDEADRISERVRRGVRSAAMSGKPTGRKLYGYTRTYDERTGELLGQVPDGVRSEVVVEVARRFLAGESLMALARDLNRRGVPTSTGQGKWENLRLSRLLRNPAYNAQRVHRGKVVGPAEWPAILDDETFARLTVKFADPTRRTTRGGTTKHLLTGIARCGVCGGPLRYASDRGRRLYACRSEGFHVVRGADYLDAYVVATVLERLGRPDAAELLTTDPTDDVLAARAEAEQLRARITDATEQFIAGNLTGATLARIEGELLGRIADIERRARFIGLPTTVAELVDAASVWDGLTVEQRSEVIRSLVVVRVDRVAVPGRKGFDTESVSIEWLR